MIARIGRYGSAVVVVTCVVVVVTGIVVVVVVTGIVVVVANVVEVVPVMTVVDVELPLAALIMAVRAVTLGCFGVTLAGSNANVRRMSWVKRIDAGSVVKIGFF